MGKDGNGISSYQVKVQPPIEFGENHCSLLEVSMVEASRSEPKRCLSSFCDNSLWGIADDRRFSSCMLSYAGTKWLKLPTASDRCWKESDAEPEDDKGAIKLHLHDGREILNPGYLSWACLQAASDASMPVDAEKHRRTSSSNSCKALAERDGRGCTS